MAPDTSILLALFALGPLGGLVILVLGKRVLRGRDESETVRAQAARALGVVGEVRGIGPLVDLMGDHSWWVRARAAEALRALGQPGMEALRRCAREHPDTFARERAVEALSMEEPAIDETTAAA